MCDQFRDELQTPPQIAVHQMRVRRFGRRLVANKARQRKRRHKELGASTDRPTAGRPGDRTMSILDTRK
jgi:hypothetical protein